MMKKRIIWWVVFLLAATPFVWLLSLYLLSPRSLGIDPVETLLQETGKWALRFLLMTLACSPLKRLGLKAVVRFRRLLGLYSYFYASVHLMTYLIGWIEFDWPTLLEDLYKRPFIYIGMITWLVLGALAITSPKQMVKRLKKKWTVIHRFVYLAALLAWVHLWMQSRASAADAVLYGLIGVLLLSERVLRKAMARVKKRSMSIANS